MFDSLTQKFEGIFARLRGKGRLSSADVDVALAEVRVALLDADVNLGVVDAFLERIRLRTLGEEVKRSLTPGQQVVKIVHQELVKTLGSAAVPLKQGAPPSKILMVGLQGSGKTTTAAKLAVHLKNSGKRPLLVAADLQRPAAIDQLETLGQKAGVPVYADRAGRPARLVKAAIREAIRLGNDVVVIDTAGRLQIDRDLMRELSEISKEAVPDEVLLVVDATTGQEAVNVARGFLEHVPMTGVVLSKLDGDARGGAAISVREVTGCPIKFAGTGESITALEAFHPERMATRILGMGDVLSLIEKAEQTFDEDEAEKAAAKMMKGQFSLEDFLDQMQALKRMGPLQDLIAMLPGAGQLRDVRIDDRDVGRVEAIVRSMTPEERRNPKVIGGSRKRRIASGSGTSPQDVNRLLKQFADAQRMMKMLSSGRGLPGMAQGRRMKR
jgi:signal recognition particle subunit SRP54